MTKIVLIGAGSLQYGCSSLGDIFQSKVLREADTTITLLDIDSKTLDVTLNVGKNYIEKHNLPFSINATTDRKEALKDADFIVISIEVGGRFKLWEQDWRVPQQFGITQIYGENGGAGGLFHSLRIIPPILDICQDIADICPNAFIFNHSNPMSRICTTVHRKFPQLKFYGLCHEIAHLERFLPPILDMKFSDMSVQAAGLNHFSMLLQATNTKTGEDLYPKIRENAAKFFEKRYGYSEVMAHVRKTGKSIQTEAFSDKELQLDVDEVRPWSDLHLFKFLFETTGLMPITTDSHMGEYIGWAHDVADHKGILDFFNLYKDYLAEVDPSIKDELHERFVPMAEAIITNNEYEELAVNLPNKGYIKDLPEWIVVEVPAIVNKDGAKGVNVDIPKAFAGHLTNQIGIHDLTAQAIIDGSKDMVIQALMVDPVTSKVKDIDKLVNLMIETQSPWLDYLK